MSNFVDRYLPIQIQHHITENLSLIPDQQIVQLVKEFEKKKYKEFHLTVVEDDGESKLALKSAEIRNKA